MESQLSLEQKIKVIVVLDKLLAVFKIFSLYIVENRDFQLYHVKIWKIDVSLQISNRTKFWSKIVTTLIFFPVKAEIPYFSKIQKGGQKGGQGMSYSDWKFQYFFQILNFGDMIQSKIHSSLAPLLAPLFNFWKVWNLSFHWKKKLMSYPS